MHFSKSTWGSTTLATTNSTHISVESDRVTKDQTQFKDNDALLRTKGTSLRPSFGLNDVSSAQNVSLCFLLDTTGSMAQHINGVKNQIKEIVASLSKKNTKIESISFVGYKDWYDGDDHFEVLDFTESIDTFHHFLGEIKPKGGGDIPEDVLGGLSRAANLKWSTNDETRIIFHIADAPPHGRHTYHYHPDHFPNGHFKDPNLQDLFTDMKLKGITYYFGAINKECNKMIQVFNQFMESPIVTFDVENVHDIHSSVVSSVIQTVSSSTIVTDTCNINSYENEYSKDEIDFINKLNKYYSKMNV